MTTLAMLTVLLVTSPAVAQLNWEGQTGALITPFAYTSPSTSRGLGHPELGFYYLNEGPVLGTDLRASFTIGFLRIGEIGYTRVFNAEGTTPALSPLFANGFNLGHVKFRLVPENAHGIKFVPAIAAGAVVRTQVRRLTEVTERENTTASDFYAVATKSIPQLTALPLLLSFGAKVTNASMMGIAANSPNWKLKAFGAAAVTVKGPAHSKLVLGAEFAQQPHTLKEIPGATVPTTLAYFVRVFPAGDVPLTLNVGVAQLAGNLGQGLALDARHQFTFGVSYGF